MKLISEVFALPKGTETVTPFRSFTAVFLSHFLKSSTLSLFQHVHYSYVTVVVGKLLFPSNALKLQS